MPAVTDATYNPAGYAADLTSSARGYQLPHPLAPSARTDVERIARGLLAVDVDVADLLASVATKAAAADVYTQGEVDGAISAAIDALIGGAPGALDTLNELAAAIGDDDDYAASVTAALAGKSAIGHGHAIGDVSGLQSALDDRLALSGGTLAGALTATDLTVNGVLTAASWIEHAGDADTRFGFPSNNSFRIETGGAERVSVNGNGLQLSNAGARIERFETSVSPTNSDRAPTSKAVADYVAAAASSWTYLATQTRSSGSAAVTFTIPSGATEVAFEFTGVSLNGNNNLRFRIGDAGGIETAGYSSAAVRGGSDSSSTASFLVLSSGSGAVVHLRGRATRMNAAGTLWSLEYSGGSDVGDFLAGSGSKTLSAELTTLEFEAGGSDNWDNAATFDCKWR